MIIISIIIIPPFLQIISPPHLMHMCKYIHMLEYMYTHMHMVAICALFQKEFLP